jgi:hypothetical protein
VSETRREKEKAAVRARAREIERNGRISRVIGESRL